MNGSPNSRLTSKFRTGFDNLSVPVSTVTRIQKQTCNDHFSVLYFYGVSDKSDSQVIRTWFYKSESDLEKDIIQIQRKYPDLVVE